MLGQVILVYVRLGYFGITYIMDPLNVFFIFSSDSRFLNKLIQPSSSVVLFFNIIITSFY
jgi:hypothetical protein